MSAPSVVSLRVPLGQRINALYRRYKFRLSDRFSESALEKHAKKELEVAGMYDQDADYGPGKIADEVMKLIRVLGRAGHSGGSHHLVMEIFNRVGNFKRLTALTRDPSEWMDVSSYSGPEGTPVFQSRRQSTCFTNDPTFSWYYDIDEKGRPHHPIPSQHEVDQARARGESV